MDTRRTTLGSGLSISRVLTGLWQIADMERSGTLLDPVDTAPAMAPYAEAGLSTFDMADHYGSAELIAGQFRKQYAKEAEVQLLTKWVPKPGKSSKGEVREAVERSLKRLQGESIDLLQFHAWHYPDPVWLDQLFWLSELQEEGLIRHLGLTNFDAAHVRVACASGIPIVSNQVSYSLLDQRAGGEMTAVCEEYGVQLLAFGTLAGGFLSDRWLGRPEPVMDGTATWSQMKYKRFIDTIGGWPSFQRLLQVLDQIARQHEVSIANVATRFILDQPAVAGVIVGARLGERAHIDDTLRVFDFSLTAADKAAIRQVQDTFLPVPGDCGDEYRKPPFLTASGDLSHHLETFPLPFQPVPGPRGSTQVFSGTPWEGMAGYSRAVRKGRHIYVSGSTSAHGAKRIGGDDPAAQTHFVLDKIEAAIISLGGTMEDVVRTRIFVNDIRQWEPVARAHGSRFAGIFPANTLVEAPLVAEGYLVEIEAEAEIPDA